jgi:hypothetical protein
LVGVVSDCCNSNIILAVGIEVASYKGVSKVIGCRTTSQNHIRTRGTGRVAAVVVEDVDLAGGSVVEVGADGEVGAAVGVEVTGREGRAEVVRSSLPRNVLVEVHLAGLGVEDVGAAGVGIVYFCPHN